MMEMELTIKQETVWAKNLDRKSCPLCGSAVTIVYGGTIFNALKPYSCVNGHLVLVGLFSDNIAHVCYYDDTFVNMEEFDNKCKCGSNVKELDDFVATKVIAPGIKTKMRVGDIWDSRGIEPVRSGTYTDKGEYIASSSQQANKERMKKMHKERNIKEERMPGRKIKSPTQKDYGYRSKDSLRE